MLCSSLIVSSGFLQYLYVLIRTVQGAQWVEASASTLPQLLELIRADSYREFVLPVTWQSLATVYLPRLAEFARLEYGVVGLACAGIGVLWCVRRDWRTSMLLMLSTIGVIALVIRLSGDLRGFLVPAWVVVAVFLAAGGDALQHAASRLPGRAWAALAAIALACLPIWPLRANFAANDWSYRTDDARFLRAVVEYLPARAAIVREDFVLAAMLNYLEAIERHPKWAGLVRPGAAADSIAPLLEDGIPVFAFDRGSATLVAQDFNFDRVRVLSQPLVDYVGELPPGSVVAIAARETWLPVELAGLVGLSPSAASAAPRLNQALVVTIGSTPTFVQDAVEASALIEPSADVPALRHRVEVRASGEAVLATYGDQILEAAADGLVILTVDARSGAVESHALEPPDLRVARAASPALYRLPSRRPGVEAGASRWTDAGAVAAYGRLGVTVNNFAAFDAAVTVYASAAVPLSPGADTSYQYGPFPAFDVRLFDREVERDRADLVNALASDGLSLDRIGGARHVARIHQTVNDRGDSSSWVLSLGAIPERVWVRGVTDLPNPRRVTVSSAHVRRYLDEEVVSLINAGGAYDWIFVQGWHPPARDATGEFRWAANPDARLRLPIAGASAIDVTLSVLGRASALESPHWVGLSMNGVDLGRCPLDAGWTRCTWRAPATAVVDGMNEFMVQSPPASPAAREAVSAPDARDASVAVRQIMLRRR